MRKIILTRTDKLDAEYIRDTDAQIAASFFDLDAYQHADQVFIYASYRKEIDTFAIITRMLADGKAVYVPKVISRKCRKMTAIRIHTLDELKPGYMGIPEPIGVDDNQTYCDSKIKDAKFDIGNTCYEKSRSTSLIVLPCLYIDENFNRLGYGGGFYDTFLEEHIGRPVNNSISKPINKQIKMPTIVAMQRTKAISNLGFIESEMHDFKADIVIDENSVRTNPQVII